MAGKNHPPTKRHPMVSRKERGDGERFHHFCDYDRSGQLYAAPPKKIQWTNTLRCHRARCSDESIERWVQYPSGYIVIISTVTYSLAPHLLFLPFSTFLFFHLQHAFGKVQKNSCSKKDPHWRSQKEAGPRRS